MGTAFDKGNKIKLNFKKEILDQSELFAFFFCKVSHKEMLSLFEFKLRRNTKQLLKMEQWKYVKQHFDLNIMELLHLLQVVLYQVNHAYKKHLEPNFFNNLSQRA